MSVVDASVALKWVLEEAELAAQAAQLFEDTVQARQLLAAPPHFTGEVANAILQRHRRGQISRQATQAALDAFLDFAIPTLSPPDLYERALDLALTYTLPSLYDSLYVALAQALGVTLWTADQRLVNALAGRLDFVRWLGDYHSPAPS